ncbi:protein-lysine methyltransferase METTL21E-like [Bombina bombina]|uniref:protein-lysine methyltransferase METTL21E-like n=1 Tax=Bombina bombina TaxID=8345 RepID=UPI00235B0F30|nr:protein-lysine methyltransferase METTL21E-like [Bombina bombina]
MDGAQYLTKPVNESKMEENQENCSENDLIALSILDRRYIPSKLTSVAWEGFYFVGNEIKIVEATDLYGATVWPSALVLCYFLEKHGKQINIEDKHVLEIGAGTGLASIVACLLGAHVMATDLKDLIGNLQYNISRNTKLKCKHEPQVREMTWGFELEKSFPKSSLKIDYILAGDVVYDHPYLEELIATFDHLCQENTIIIWAMKFRKENRIKEKRFIEKFQKLFDMEVVYDFPSLTIQLYRAVRRKRIISSV